MHVFTCVSPYQNPASDCLPNNFEQEVNLNHQRQEVAGGVFSNDVSDRFNWYSPNSALLTQMLPQPHRHKKKLVLKSE
jgi:hypothetical protein